MNMSTQFCVSKYTDSDLQALQKAVQNEIALREDARRRRREEWIHRYYNGACHRAVFEVIGNTVVVAVDRNGSIHMAQAHPVKGDVFDMRTGVAVAYCKAMGLRVPDFI
jgi:hypothetical protein